ncbi:hypothetical protein [Synechococcus sp. H70.2]|uniref:hypothetical protein n=1 Tax=unclassified Synechococcus TaxID=2626047 RepID=UPI0039C190B8
MPPLPDPSPVDEKKAACVRESETSPGCGSLSPAARRLLQLYHGGSFVLLSLVWLLVGIPSLWALRADLLRLWQYFTWTGLRYALFYRPSWPTFGLLLCVSFTLGILVAQSRYELFGLYPFERWLLERQSRWILSLPPWHPLRRWLVRTLNSRQ